MIWAYKILFLDVLFPLNLRKVIFVDSDQVIRADFAELWNMDLKVGAANPLCMPRNAPCSVLRPDGPCAAHVFVRRLAQPCSALSQHVLSTSRLPCP